MRPSRLPELHLPCAGATLARSNKAPPRLTGTIWSQLKPNFVRPLTLGSIFLLHRWQVQPPGGVFSLYQRRMATHLGSFNHHEFDMTFPAFQQVSICVSGFVVPSGSRAMSERCWCRASLRWDSRPAPSPTSSGSVRALSGMTRRTKRLVSKITQGTPSRRPSTATNVALDAKTRAIANVYRCKCITRRQASEPSTDNNLSLDAKHPINDKGSAPQSDSPPKC